MTTCRVSLLEWVLLAMRVPLLALRVPLLALRVPLLSAASRSGRRSRGSLLAQALQVALRLRAALRFEPYDLTHLIAPACRGLEAPAHT